MPQIQIGKQPATQITIMGEVDHVHDAENERQTRGDQRQDHADDYAVHRLNDQQVDRNALEEMHD